MYLNGSCDHLQKDKRWPCTWVNRNQKSIQSKCLVSRQVHSLLLSRQRKTILNPGKHGTFKDFYSNKQTNSHSGQSWQQCIHSLSRERGGGGGGGVLSHYLPVSEEEEPWQDVIFFTVSNNHVQHVPAGLNVFHAIVCWCFGLFLVPEVSHKHAFHILRPIQTKLHKYILYNFQLPT